jgi:outer membrane autotransporter protein
MAALAWAAALIWSSSASAADVEVVQPVISVKAGGKVAAEPLSVNAASLVFYEASGLPIWLSVDRWTGSLTGTAPNAFETSVVTIEVTDLLTGEVVSAKVTVRVFGDLAAKVPKSEIILDAALPVEAFQPVVGVTSTASRLAYEISPPLPAGLSFDSGSGLMWGVAEAPSPETLYTVNVTAEGVFKAPGSFTLKVIQTKGTDDAASTVEGQSVRVDVTANDGPGSFLGLSLVTQPGNGKATLDGLMVVYTPNASFVGTDNFVYRATWPDGRQVPAMVTVTVTARPVPKRDPNARALILAQGRFALLSAEAQIQNFAQRLVALHGGAGSGNRIRIMGAQPAAAPGPLPYESRAGERPEWSIWSGGTIMAGRQAEDEDAAETRFRMNGVSGGIDWRIDPDVAFGVGIGLGYDDARIGQEELHLRSLSADAVVYGSWRAARGIYLDGLMGAGRMKMESRRQQVAALPPARGVRNGNRTFGAMTLTAEVGDEHWTLAPYVAATMVRATLAPFMEQGPIALLHEAHEVQARSFRLGLRASAHLPATIVWGTLTPRLKVEWQRTSLTRSRAEIAFASTPEEPRFIYEEEGRGYGRALAGAGLAYENGPYVLSVDWSGLVGSRSFESDTIGTEFRIRF